MASSTIRRCCERLLERDGLCSSSSVVTRHGRERRRHERDGPREHGRVHDELRTASTPHGRERGVDRPGMAMPLADRGSQRQRSAFPILHGQVSSPAGLSSTPRGSLAPVGESVTESWL